MISIIVLILGCIAMAFCLAILMVPKIVRQMIDFFSIGSRLYLAALLRLALGVMLLILASQTRFWGYVVTVGLLAAASGLSMLFFALRRTKKLLSRLQRQPNFVLRLLVIIALAIWALLFYALLPTVPAFGLR